jgi:predicted TPR repeat methyltransferase
MQISTGVFAALQRAVPLSEDLVVMDFGAGTGLVSEKLAPHVGRILAVDVSAAMLAKLAEKTGLQGTVEIVCQDLLHAPLGRRVDLVVSAMAMHHVQDTAELLRVFFEHLEPGGRVALADLDVEDGDFHPHDTEGVFHAGFDRAALGALLVGAGFEDVHFETACDVTRDDRRYPVFLVTAVKPG